MEKKIKVHCDCGAIHNVTVPMSGDPVHTVARDTKKAPVAPEKKKSNVMEFIFGAPGATPITSTVVAKPETSDDSNDPAESEEDNDE